MGVVTLVNQQPITTKTHTLFDLIHLERDLFYLIN